MVSISRRGAETVLVSEKKNLGENSAHFHFTKPDGDLRLDYEVTLGIYPKNHQQHEKYPVTKSVPNFQEILESGHFTDVTITCKHGQALYAHKAILAAKSQVKLSNVPERRCIHLLAGNDHFCICLFQYFRNMFSTNFKENRSGEVKIGDFDVKTMRSLITYLYTDNIPTDEQELDIELMKASDLYGELALKLACESAVIKRLNLDEALKILVISFKHEAPDLKRATLALVCDHIEFVKEMDEWKTLPVEHPSVFMELMAEAFGRKCD